MSNFERLSPGAYIPNMISNFVSLHPYFKVHPGKLDAIKAILPRLVQKTATEGAVLLYEFTMNDDELFCREGYENAEGLLAHLDNVGALLAEATKMADLTRVEVHGPAKEPEKLKAPLAHLSPTWFTIEGPSRTAD
jgi:quinol monooxygenase YgiN